MKNLSNNEYPPVWNESDCNSQRWLEPANFERRGTNANDTRGDVGFFKLHIDVGESIYVHTQSLQPIGSDFTLRVLLSKTLNLRFYGAEWGFVAGGSH